MNIKILKAFAACMVALSFLFCTSSAMAQPVQVSGRCITGTVNLTVDASSPLNGKVWYSGFGTVLGFPGVNVNIYWDNVVNKWYLDFDGQAYFENSDNTTLPPSTNIASWVPTVDNTDCLSGPALSITGSGTGDREINVKQNTTNIDDGGSFNYGNVNIGSNDSKVFTIENTGNVSLTLTGTPNYVIKGGSNPGDFTITQPATGTITAASSTAFTVVFAPGGPGARSCTLQIPNNDGNENPYDITLNGTGVCPTITFTATPTNTCAGGSNGQIAVSGVTGGTGPYTYSKDNGANYQAGATFTGLAANTYQVVVKDNFGCTSGATPVIVGSNPNPTPVITGPTSVCSGGSVMLDAGAGYTNYAWSNAGGSGQTATFSNITSPTTYTVTVTAANGCTGTDTHAVTINPSPSCSITFTNPPPWEQDTACANSTGNVYSATAGMSTYSWGISGQGSIIGATNASSVTVTAGASGSYSLSVTITNANGCSSTCSDQTPIKSSPTCILSGPSSVVCNSTGNVYSVNNGAFPISSYIWNVSGDAMISGPSNGSSVTVTAGASNFSVNVTSVGFNACPSHCSQNVTVQTCIIDFSGKIIFSNDSTLGVGNATVNLTGSATGSDVSDTNGDFFISSGISSGSFALTPTKTVNKLNGVTAGDITAIQQHVANITPITNLYKQVAADVNKSNSINTLDASVINQSLLGNPTALAQFKTSWRFVPTSHTMANPPWSFPEQRSYTSINASQTNQNFYGIKTGDVVTTFADPANFGAGQPFVLRDKDQVLQAGEILTVALSADQLDDLAAFQCALRFDPAKLQFMEIQPMTALPLTLDNFGIFNIAEGEIRLVWAQATGVALSEAAPVFNIKFTALQSGSKLSEVLQLDESELPAVSYTGALAESKLELKFSELTGTGNPAGESGVQLLQNRPNPFNGTTTIGFVLPEACEAQLRIFDTAGRMLAERKAQYPPGKSAEVFDLKGVSGILWYELTTPFGTLTKKMVTTGN